MDISLNELVNGLTDPRVDRTRVHSLSNIMTIALCSILSYGDSWVDMELFGKCKYDWLKTFLDLKNGIPSDDTFRRVISAIDPDEFELCFRHWVSKIVKKYPQVIAIDGKTLCGSRDGEKKPLHMVSAWACENQMVFGQVATEEKSNEITAIPKLLKTLALEGCTVTIDAMGCQKKIAKSIKDANAEYIFSLKGNHGDLNEKVRLFMDDFIEKDSLRTANIEVNSGHGRIEKRTTWYSNNTEWLDERKLWAGLSGFVAVRSERTVDGNTSVETRYFITSLNNISAEKIGAQIRQHWEVENCLHWCLDVTFGEDACTIRKKNGPQNISLLKKITLNILKNNKTKGSIKGKRKKAGWDDAFMANLLGI